LVFAAEAGLFVVAAYLAVWIGKPLGEQESEQPMALASQAGSMT
jgi:hypothetical protein